MSHWTVGEGRSTGWAPPTRWAEQIAAEDADRSAYLTERLKGEYRERPQRLLCSEGHTIDGERQRSNGRSYRYCKRCASLRMNRIRHAQKARAG